MAPTRNATPLARAVDLSGAWNASDDDLAARFHPVYGAALARLPDGAAIFRGLPFALGRRDGGNRWLLVREPITIELPEAEPASHVVVAHFSDSWRDDSGRRPPGMAVGWVAPAGEELARYELELADGGRHEVVIRRRFEVADGIIGWGVLPFDAIGHRSDEPIDWRGPHARLTSGRYPRAGDAGLLAMLPGSWGPAQTSVADYVPTPDDDITYWLHAIPVAAENGGGGDVTERAVVRRLHVQPFAGGRPGSDVVIAAITLFRGTADPLVVAPRRQVLVTGWSGGLPAIDLGVAIAARPLPARGVRDGDAGPIGWGSGRDVAPAADPHIVVDLAVAPDGRVAFGDLDLSVADLDAGAASGDGRVRVTPLAAADIRTTVRITADGTASPARVRFVAADGRYLPPLGHREEINPGLFEDSGAGLLLGGETFAYVPGEFRVDLPPGPVTIEIVKGFEHRPIRREAVVDPAHTSLDLALERAVDLRPAGWWSSDAHVHFIAPTTALLQAAAEDVNFVHVLATQLGDEFKSVPDLAWGGGRDATGRHAVFVGTENRQNLLGHLALLGAQRPVLPMASGGAPEGRIGQATTELLADWATACRAEGGLVIGAHFPLPYAEIAADIVAGAIDAIELQTFAPGFDHPSIAEWYRFLNCGFRLPLLGGTDKMSAEVPLGAIRTYARLGTDLEPTFDAWAAAIRAGRTFATSGPVIELTVEGREPGDVIALPRGGGRLAVHVRARAAQPVIDAVEIVVNGRVAARRDADASGDASVHDLVLETEIAIDGGSWIAARSTSRHEIHSAFATSMAAHTSPVYVEVVDRPLFVSDDAAAILAIIEGTVRWLERMATIGDPALRTRLAGRVASTAATLRARLGPISGGPPS